MLVKVCGLRNPENIEALTALPIDWMGFIFYPKSSRFVGEINSLSDTANAALKVTQKRVGVFVNAKIEEIEAAVQQYKLDYVQLHGQESPSFCAVLQEVFSSKKIGIIKAFSVDEGFDFTRTKAYETGCQYFLFDTKGKLPGGTGMKFNWEVLQKYKGETPFLLSGGIGPKDASLVKDFEHPQCIGIDVNSKFEDSPALKNIDEVTTFLEAVLNKENDEN